MTCCIAWTLGDGSKGFLGEVKADIGRDGFCCVSNQTESTFAVVAGHTEGAMKMETGKLAVKVSLMVRERV